MITHYDRYVDMNLINMTRLHETAVCVLSHAALALPVHTLYERKNYPHGYRY